MVHNSFAGRYIQYPVSQPHYPAGWYTKLNCSKRAFLLHLNHLATFLSDEEAFEFIRTTIEWYAQNGKGMGRARIGSIMQDPKKWASYVETVRSKFGDKIVENPKPPTPTEIHL